MDCFKAIFVFNVICFVFKFNLPFVFSTINYFKTLPLKLVIF